MLFQDPDAFLAEIEEIAALGAKQLMAHWRALDPDQINEKARNDLVSAADLASEEAIIGAIRSRFPDHNILSEEAGHSTQTDGEPTWIIDPLDGTTNFVHGIPQFA
ncbi:MAG: inositol monophosphatase, partial [Acidobacteria bacterium]|nr:inositol monophosphatase [Candidatus Sulfomarinibacter kjeldsenii]